ncbi:MAG TPA: lytic transglycosylase domain-containing protein [Pseudonocardiaceae bacterium]|nr:lytic transglycosylase domain-containing protein [Pseudonocardiaceae bacterium]
MAGQHALDDHEDEREDHEGSAFDSMMSSSDESEEAYDDEESRPRRRRRRPMWGGWALLAVLVLLLAGGGVWLHDLVTKPPPKAAPSAPTFTILPLNVNPGDSVPSAPAPFPASVPGPKDPQTAWITRLSTETYLPSRALTAYMTAQTLLAQRDPGCGINWTTLAGIGWVESHHGQYGGGSIGPDNRETRPIIGPALDGTNGTQRIPDTDHGALDGDTQWDRALGPMQFLPTTWREWGQRASGDGQAPDPQNIADAALTAGNYLCRSVGDMTTPANWWKAVYIYNNSDEYGVEVYSAAQAYSDATR